MRTNMWYKRKMFKNVPRAEMCSFLHKVIFDQYDILQQWLSIVLVTERSHSNPGQYTNTYKPWESCSRMVA